MTVLLLDVMGTLVYDPFPEEVPAFFGMTLDELYALKDPRAWQEFELGQLDEAGLAARYFLGDRPCDIDGLRETLEGSYRLLEGIEELLSELQGRGVPMHALSNYGPWYELIDARLGLSRFLRWSFVSCDVGVRKPDPRAYLGAAQRLGVSPAECLFVDDRVENCAGAEAVGMPSILFEGADALRERLAARGIL